MTAGHPRHAPGAPATGAVDPSGNDGAPDLVLDILSRVGALLPDFSADLRAIVEAQVRAEYGGARHYIQRRGRHLTPHEQAIVCAEGVTNKPTEDIVRDHGISRRTLYRLLKSGPRSP